MNNVERNNAMPFGEDLVATCGANWQRFWFTPSDVTTVCVLRILTALAAFGYVLSFTPDMMTWFGAGGLLPTPTVGELTNDFHPSYLSLLDAPVALWSAHALGLVVVAAFLLGLLTRVMSVLTLVVVLSYIHRAPMLAGQFESVLSMLLLYLCLAPCGRLWSIDGWLVNRRSRGQVWLAPSTAATVSIRLIQVHLVLWYFTMGLTKLAGETWWTGDAVWWLITRTESRLVDMTSLHRSYYLVNLWTHAIVVYELSFGLLIWNRLARPILLGLSLVMWISLALITGMISFCLVMLIANVAFLAPHTLATVLARFPVPPTIRRPATQ